MKTKSLLILLVHVAEQEAYVIPGSVSHLLWVSLNQTISALLAIARVKMRDGNYSALMAHTTDCVNGAFRGVSDAMDAMMVIFLLDTHGAVDGPTCGL